LGITAKGTDGHGDYAHLFQLRDPTASSMRSDHADVSGVKLSQLPLLRRAGRYGAQHLNTGGSSFWGRPESWLRPDPPEGKGRLPLGESTRTGF
jgi:hypothetical protein